MKRRPVAWAAADEIADRVAVLLGAGLAAPLAWSALEGDSEPIRTVVATAERSRSIGAALAAAVADAPFRQRPGWAALAAAIRLAERTGAPLAAVLEALAEALREAAEAERDIEIALTGPRLSSRLVLALPIIGVLLAFALGFDPVSALLGSPLGIGCLAVGGGLLVAGRWWTRRLVRQASPVPGIPGIELELAAAALAGSAPAEEARELVLRIANDGGLVLPQSGAALDGALRLSARTGIPIARLLRTEARRCRRNAAADARLRAERLAVALLLPLGVCVLPSFLLLGVAPLLLSLVSSTSFGF